MSALQKQFSTKIPTALFESLNRLSPLLRAEINPLLKSVYDGTSLFPIDFKPITISKGLVETKEIGRYNLAGLTFDISKKSPEIVINTVQEAQEIFGKMNPDDVIKTMIQHRVDENKSRSVDPKTPNFAAKAIASAMNNYLREQGVIF